MKSSTKDTNSPIVAVDTIIFTISEGELKVLLIKMKKAPFENTWAAPGGRVRLNESTDASAERVLREKAGVRDVYLEQLYTFGEVDRDPYARVVSVSYFALISSEGLLLETTEEYAGVEWFSISDLPKLAYDHKKILNYAIKRLQSKLEYTNIVCNLLPKEFTLSEMQSVYETVLKTKMDKRNFRKKIDSLGIVKKTGKKTSGGAHRPADLYKFIEKKHKLIQIV